MRDYVPYAGDFGQYGQSPEHVYFGEDSYSPVVNQNGSSVVSPTAPGAPAAPGSPTAPGYSASEGRNDPAKSLDPGVGLNAVSPNLASFAGSLMNAAAMVTNPGLAIPTGILSAMTTGKFNTSPIDFATRSLTGKGILGNLADVLGIGGGDPFSGAGGRNASAPNTLGGVSDVDIDAFNSMNEGAGVSGGVPGPQGAPSPEYAGDHSGNEYREGGPVHAFLGGFFDDLVSGVGDLFSSAGDSVGDLFSSAGDGISDAYNNLFSNGDNSLSLFDQATYGSGLDNPVSNNLPPLGDAIEVPVRAEPVPVSSVANVIASSSDPVGDMMKELYNEKLLSKTADSGQSWFSRNKLPLLLGAGILGSSIFNSRKAMPKSVISGGQNKSTYGQSLPVLAFNRKFVGPNGSPSTYGYRGESNYFSDNAVPRASGGVLSRYVTGPGDGRDDKIPAMLSNNEYVIDAETVALLGNGSPDHGAAKLDAMRENIRRHKGKSLSRGRFSQDARDPMEYMR